MGIHTTMRSTSERAEHLLGLLSSPIKPHLPALSRFLVVATFYEDSLRIAYQWSDQVRFLEKARHFPGYTASMFLGFNALSMAVFASCIILKRQVGLSVAVLAAVITGQAIAYGLVFDLKQTQQYVCVAPTVDMNGEWNYLRMVVSFVGLTACAMVIVGFRAKWSATFLVSLLCVINMLVNNWWSTSHSNYKRDFLRYDFFQCLSIMGGLLLLVTIGPGGLSYDEKKKEY
ncbi:hypothetical protein [Parasitella parasitica]|uniref:Surfeit locus protein 4 n=1 Tax=Parasitella parasitica TaxID=35722 RepID=A0A0B7MR46_9FUNG|nr:hypothetical protein [Parasitella parasitica]